MLKQLIVVAYLGCCAMGVAAASPSNPHVRNGDTVRPASRQWSAGTLTGPAPPATAASDASFQLGNCR